VVVGGDRLAQLPQSRHGCVLLVRRIHRDRVDARRGSRELARLRLTLAEVAPVGAGRIEAALLGLGGDEDDAGTGNRTERLGGALAGHGLPRLYTPAPWRCSSPSRLTGESVGATMHPSSTGGGAQWTASIAGRS